jgi:hypothetical protein
MLVHEKEVSEMVVKKSLDRRRKPGSEPNPDASRILG